MMLSRVPLAYIKSAGQSSYSQFSHDKDESMAPLSLHAKELEYSFHTDLEYSPFWSCTFKWPITLSRLVIYNRDNPQFYERIGELRVILTDQAGHSRVVFCQKSPVFTGRRGNNPLNVDIDSVMCIGIKIETNNNVPIPLHLQEIKIFRHSPITYLESLQYAPSRLYTCSLNESGFGDKLLDLATGSYILESLGFRFAGLDSSSLNKACRITNNDHSAIDIYKQLGLYDLAADREYTTTPYILKLGNQINQPGLDGIIEHVKRDLSENLSSNTYSSIQLSVPPMLCNRLLLQDRRRSFGSSLHSEAIETVKRSINTSLNEGCSNSLNIVIHLRLGDVANLQVEKDKWMIPFESAWVKSLKFLTGNQRKLHERYDRIPLISSILANISGFSTRSKMSVTLVSDGTVGTRNFIANKLRPLEGVSSTDVLDKAIAYIDSIDERLQQMSRHVDHTFIGESSDMFIQVVRSVLNADVIISSNGHYCYQLSLISSKSPFMAMAYMPRTHRDPSKHTLYWSGNDKYDIEYVTTAIELMA